MSNQEGIVAGRYLIHGEIGAGGMATVHIGQLLGHGGFARTVAIKRLHGRFAKDPDFIAMLLDEARVVARIQHPNVVQTLDVVASDEELLVVMDYVHGESLSRLLAAQRSLGTRVPTAIVGALIADVLAGLHAAHEARSETGVPLHVVHRDVSPQNILVGVDGVSRVLDFGVAKATDRIQSTREGELKGKIAYMAPEQIENTPSDRRTDIYAASVVLWEALTGQRLFQAESEAGVLRRVLSGQIAHPMIHTPELPTELDAIVMRGLARDPSARFASAEEMSLALRRCLVPATTSDVSAWVTSLAGEALTRRGIVIADAVGPSSLRRLEEARRTVEQLRSGSFLTAAPVSNAPFSADDRAVHATQKQMPPEIPVSHAAPPLARRAVGPSSSASGRSAVVACLVATVALSAFGSGAFLLFRRARAADQKSLMPPPPDLTSATITTSARDAGPASTVLAATSDATPSSAASSGGSPSPPCPKDMVAIPGGRFFMGSDEDLPFERPAHKVTIGAYCIDRMEVTVKSYKACSDNGDCKRAGNSNKWDAITAAESKVFDPECNANAPDARAQHPINCVDWEMADRFCLSAGKRLPSEAEWEFAARGPDGRRYPWGDSEPSGSRLNACGTECVAWGKAHDTAETAMFGETDGFATTAPVGSFPEGKSPFGLEDVAGNVWEWVDDRYGPYTANDQSNPHGAPSGEERVIRGGAWNGAQASWVRPTFRYHDTQSKRSYGIGFRCAK